MSKVIELSDRMQAVADMVRKGATVADIGCDHAFVSIYLVEKGIATKVVASDVRQGPCDIAKKNIESYGLSDVIDLRLGDGLSTLKEGEVSTILIAGMGGMLINDILESSINVANAANQLILQPQSDLCKVREYVLSKGWSIEKEEMLIDMGKYYTILSICTDVENHEAWPGYMLKYGRFLLDMKHEILKKYLEEQKASFEKIKISLEKQTTEVSEKRVGEIIVELEDIEKALGHFYE